jgi:hypothetical protein
LLAARLAEPRDRERAHDIAATPDPEDQHPPRCLDSLDQVSGACSSAWD